MSTLQAQGGWMTANTLLLTAGYGWLAGMRSLAAPAAAGIWLRKQRRPRGRTARALASPLARVAVPIAAATELLVDKLPSTPNRTAPAGLAARLASGALAGAAIAQTRRGRRSGITAPAGALLGAGFALLSSYANLWLRRSASARTGGTQAGFAEDALALGLATTLARA